MDNNELGRPGGLSSASPTAPVVAAVPVLIPDAIRDPLAMAMFAAWLNVTPEQVPDKFKGHTCEATMIAWQRVGRAALAYIAVNLPDLVDEASFLCARLREFESDVDGDDAARMFYGHVTPPLSRLEQILSQGIEAGTATTGTGVVHESPVGGNADAPTPTPTLVNQGEAEILREAFPPTSCVAWEDCKHDGSCHDAEHCGWTDPDATAQGGKG